jgi:hypothetical protein
MRKYPDNSYHPGAEKRECDQCGWDYRTDELRERYDGAWVCPKEGCYDPEPRGWDKRIRGNIGAVKLDPRKI